MRRGLSLSLASGGRGLTARHSLLSTQGRGAIFSSASSRSISFFKQDAKSVEAKVGLYDHDELPYFAPESMPADPPTTADEVWYNEEERSLPAKLKTLKQVEQLADVLEDKELGMTLDEMEDISEFVHNYEEPVTADPMKVLFTKEYWEDPENWDPHDYMWAVKVWQLENSLGLKTPEERLAWRQSVDISSGYMTLEWVLPSPPPEHTFDEYPIIKDNPDDPGV